jgi:UDP-N-acetylglucosamine--N-acetylmuramyl-(pentapeptide) pyrophosphoryl-undecaprenol N-acetylglucosamine transferase
LFLLNVRGFHRRFSLQNFSFLFRLLISLLKSKKALKDFNPHLVIGTGGYVMGPVLKMALRMGYTTIIQEQNSYPGVTTRMLAAQVDAVFLAYKDAAQYLENKTNIIEAGNPVVIQNLHKDKSKIYTEFSLDQDLKTILVFGGSQGAATINKAIKNILSQKSIPKGTQLLWQCGKLQYEMYEDWLEKTKIKNIHLVPFIDDMWSAYNIAEFCICRAGAMSLSELAIAGLPALLVPLKSAAGNHQYKNARAIESKGCAKLLEDDNLLDKNLYNALTEWIQNPQKLEKMRNDFVKIAQPGAGEKIVSEIERILNDKKVWSNDS